VKKIVQKFDLIRTVFKLGIFNVFRVIRYRLGLKAGFYDIEPPTSSVSNSIFFTDAVPRADIAPLSQNLFSWLEVSFPDTPDWHQSLFSPNLEGCRDITWKKAMAVLPPGADIKEIWELSRFYWVPELALAVRGGDKQAADVLNTWLQSWVAENPPYKGVNWGCGQEVALRLLHCAQAAVLLGEVDVAQPALLNLISTCAARIAPTLHYALGQTNNHGTAEAAGLFIAGSWLEITGTDHRATTWKTTGRRWLEDRARVLILDDGSSNQYSTNYHRVVLDTYAFTELWRRELGEEPFSQELTQRMTAATRWLYEMSHPTTGNVPNFGANDGSLLLSPTRPAYRDFRPTVQLCAALFGNVLAYDSGDFEDRLALYGLPRPRIPLPAPVSRTFPNGGYHILRTGNAAAFMRFAKYRYRPGHADVLHVDLHLAGHPLLADGGSYSYSSLATEGLDQTAAHNTVEFDSRDQMPRIGRFLYGKWLCTTELNPVKRQEDRETCGAGYRDYQGATHHRSVELTENLMVVRDRVAGFESQAVLRWRLAPGSYKVVGNELQGMGFRLRVIADVPIVGFELGKGIESRYYLNKTECPVLEVKLNQPGTFTTEVSF
tara:strand:+ start:45128 stop:46939 length:1812 start_codon:yes stop_codon:yes gene_type:complete